ncbi:MAG: PKD domain-containing protein [Methanophagales archaeon]|nr:PKD domain-containing protein [Methanophagales archaeon]
MGRMNKSELKPFYKKRLRKNASQKLVSLAFIALMLCSIFAGAVSAENVSEASAEEQHKVWIEADPPIHSYAQGDVWSFKLTANISGDWKEPVSYEWKHDGTTVPWHPFDFYFFGGPEPPSSGTHKISVKVTDFDGKSKESEPYEITVYTQEQLKKLYKDRLSELFGKMDEWKKQGYCFANFLSFGDIKKAEAALKAIEISIDPKTLDRRATKPDAAYYNNVPGHWDDIVLRDAPTLDWVENNPDGPLETRITLWHELIHAIVDIQGGWYERHLLVTSDECYTYAMEYFVGTMVLTHNLVNFEDELKKCKKEEGYNPSYACEQWKFFLQRVGQIYSTHAWDKGKMHALATDGPEQTEKRIEQLFEWTGVDFRLKTIEKLHAYYKSAKCDDVCIDLGTIERRWSPPENFRLKPKDASCKCAEVGKREWRGTECYEWVCRNGNPEQIRNPACDKPDDSYDVSTVGCYSCYSNNLGSDPKIGVLSNGFAPCLLRLLDNLNESGNWVDIDVPLEELKEYPVFIIPSGGLLGLNSLPSFKSKLEQYVSNGGTLIVFSQQHGYEFDAAPGDLGGYGWLEDQSCHYRSVGINTYHPILSGQDTVICDANVDGYFTKYPENATILLTRTKNGMPAMLFYEHGEGTVIATTIYTDWAYSHHAATGDGKRIVRDMIAWAKDPKKIPTHGTGNTFDISVDLTDLTIIPPEYPRHEPGDTVNLSFEVTNPSDLTANIIFVVLDPDFEEDFVEVSDEIPPYETKTIDFTYETNTSSKKGLWRVFCGLYSDETPIAEERSRFVLMDASESYYKVDFVLKDPDGNVIREETKSDFPSEGVTEVNFTVTEPSKLGIWSLHYDIFNIGDIVIESGDGRFAVSKYGENPDGFIYQGADITFTITTSGEDFAYGSEVPFTINIYNHGDTDRNISYRAYYKDWSLRTVLSEQNVEGTLDVPANGAASITHSVHVGTDVRLSHNQLIIYASFSADGTRLGYTRRAVNVLYPKISVSLTTDKEKYYPGEDVSIHLDLVNQRSFPYSFTRVVRVLDPEQSKVFEDTLAMTITPGSQEETVNFHLPADAKLGIYSVTAEAYVNANKVGSDSTHFEVVRPYIVNVKFDHLDKAYRARENMGIDLEVSNVGAAPWSSRIDVSIPDLGVSEPRDFALEPAQTETIHYDLTIPGDITPGRHEVILTIEFDNRTEEYYFCIPQSELVLTMDRTSYNAGESLTAILSNVGGVDTTFNYSFQLRDSRGLVIYEEENPAPQDIHAGESKTLEFSIPGQATSGNYYLTAQCNDQNTGRTTRLSKTLTISGVRASLEVSTDKEVYFTDETIHASTHVTNSGRAIENATLDLKIYSGRYRVAPEVTTESFYDRLKIFNDFIEAVVDTYDYDEVGTFTVGTTGGDPEIASDDYAELMYGHPYDPWSSFTTIRINGNDYRYGTEEALGGEFISLPHFDDSSIVSTWKIDDVIITQRLTIVYSATGNPDALQIKHIVENEGEMAKDIGIRVMIDTQLADNDGAPFVIPDVGDVTKELEFIGADVPVWWTTMDSLTDPTVIAHGTLRGVGFDPDKFVIAYWPGISDTLWEYPVDPDCPITSDSAIGIWWNPVSVPAGGSREVATFYGIGYVSEAEVGGTIIWEQEIPVDSLAEGAEIDIPVDIVDLDATGKLTLVSTLFSETSQTIAQDSAYFYIAVEDTHLTLETDKAVYKPLEEITITGEVTNAADITSDYTLSLKVNGVEIYTESFSLDVGQSHLFTTTTAQDSSFILEGTVDGVTITDFIRIEYPSVNVAIIAPDVAGLAPFDVSTLIENIGNVDVTLSVAMGDETWDVTLPARESRLIETTMSITEDTILQVVISGDVEKIVQKEIIMGEDAEIEITPGPIYLEGEVEIPFTIENTGLLDTEFEATFSIDDKTVSRSFFVPKDHSITDSVSLNLTKGSHFLKYVSPFEEVNVTINVLSPPEFIVTSIIPENMNFIIGQDVTVTFVVKNIGWIEGEVAVRLSMPDFEDTKSTWIAAGEEEEISFTFTLSDDLEEKNYKGIYELDGKRDEFTFFVQGVKISVEASLDKNLYGVGETAVLTLGVTNERDFDLELYSRVKFNGYDEVQEFSLAGLESKELTFNIPIEEFTGAKMLYTVYESSGRALYINSMYVYPKPPEEGGITVHTDKQVYSCGEDVTIYIEPARTDTLTITAPDFIWEGTVSGSTTLCFTLPELRSGTYYIDYTFGDFSSSYPFDVIGYSARIVEFSLDKWSYEFGETMRMEANVEVNRDISGVFKVQIYDPEDELIDEFEIPRDFIQGENKLEMERTLSTAKSGIHALVYEVYADPSGHSLIVMASGAEYFDAVGLLDAEFSAEPTEIKVCEDVKFTDLTTGINPPYTYGWDFDNDGSIDSTDPNPTWEYAEPGTYTVSLTVTDDEGNTDTETKIGYITVVPVLNVDFSATPTETKIFEDIKFTDKTTGGFPPYTYEWDFNNDESIDDNLFANPFWYYTEPGTYTVSLKVTDAKGNVDTETKIDYIIIAVTANRPPVADADGPYTGYEGSAIIFNASGSSDPDDFIVSWEWDIDGDGIYETNATVNNGIVNHTWRDDYFGNVSLKVTDSFGAIDIENTTATVLNVAPIVEAGPDQEVFAGDTVNFNGSFTDPGWLDTHTIKWNFGDGYTATGTLTPTHIYYDKGVYNVTLTVIDDDSGIGNDSTIITVLAAYDIKEDAITELEAINTTDKHAQKDIDKAIKHINKSLEDSLWIDASHLDPKHGHKVFDEEKKAVKDIMHDLCKCKEVTNLTLKYNGIVTVDIEVYDGSKLIVSYTNVRPGGTIFIDGTTLPKGKLGAETTVKIYDNATETLTDTQKIHTSCSQPLDVGMAFGDLEVTALNRMIKCPECCDVGTNVIDKLVKADKLLAETALNDAISTNVTDPKKQDKVDHEIAKAKEELTKAAEEVSKGKPDKAIDHYKKAWEHAQQAIKHAQKLPKK